LYRECLRMAKIISIDVRINKEFWFFFWFFFLIFFDFFCRVVIIILLESTWKTNLWQINIWLMKNKLKLVDKSEIWVFVGFFKKNMIWQLFFSFWIYNWIHILFYFILLNVFILELYMVLQIICYIEHQSMISVFDFWFLIFFWFSVSSTVWLQRRRNLVKTVCNVTFLKKRD